MTQLLQKADSINKSFDLNQFCINSLFFIFTFWLLNQVAYLFEVVENVSVFYPPSGFAMLLIYRFGAKYLPIFFIAIIVGGLPQRDIFNYDLGLLYADLRHLVIYGAAGLMLRKINIKEQFLNNTFFNFFILIAISTALLSSAIFTINVIELDNLFNQKQLHSISSFFVGNLSGALMALPMFVFFMHFHTVRFGHFKRDISVNVFKPDKAIVLMLLLMLSFLVIYLGSFNESFSNYYYFILIPIIWSAVKWGLNIGLIYAFIGNIFTLTIYILFSFSHIEVLELQVICSVSIIATLLIGQLYDQKDFYYENSMVDELTGLANMRLFKSVSTSMIASAKRNKDKNAVLFIDIDGFKSINDAFGHSAGDELLKLISQILKSCIRDSDSIARFGGDEFIIQLDGNTSENGAKNVASKIIESIANSFSFDESSIQIGASIGISMYPADGKDSDTLINKADRAMYAAKESGKNCYRFYKSE
jgi:diguanylate cyclase (GGDEF)-like protein